MAILAGIAQAIGSVIRLVLQLHGYCLKAVHLSRCTSCSLCWTDHHTYPATFKMDHSCLAYLKSIKSDLASLVSPLICPSGTVRIQCPMSPLLCLIENVMGRQHAC